MASKARTIRVALLVAVLVAVLVYAVRDFYARRERNAWRRTLEVAFVVVVEPGVDGNAVGELRRRVSDLSARLASELARYRPGAPRPFAFTAYGPVSVAGRPPGVDGEGVVASAGYAWDLYRFTRDLDERANVPSRAFDARLYLVLSPPSERAVVEGMSEKGGRVGIARAELDPDSVDVALFVAAHELFHTLGAGDHYGPDGRALVPDGLAEPDRVPLYPQDFAEIMARNRPLSATEEARPASLAELAVGRATAAEIGWLKQ